MKILFIHQNFPGQYKHLARFLIEQSHEVSVLIPDSNNNEIPIKEIRRMTYSINRLNGTNIHPWILDMESKIIRAEACALAASNKKKEGYYPDIIFNHPGWGESLMLKDVWPRARLVSHGEFYYHSRGFDVGFDKEFDEPELLDSSRIRLKNLNADLYLPQADKLVTSTKWQAQSFPEPYQKTFEVIHEGIDTECLRPDHLSELTIQYPHRENAKISTADGVVTFVSRDLEPLRGFHTFMRALPMILEKNPNCKILVVGGDGAGYGPQVKKFSQKHKNWREFFINELGDEITHHLYDRVHFLGRLPYEIFIKVLKLSTVHVYLTYPFVLSWSLIEAMSLGKTIIASNTAPVSEVLEHEATALLVDFFDQKKLATQVIDVLQRPVDFAGLGANARKEAVARYDINTVSLPRYAQLLKELN